MELHLALLAWVGSPLDPWDSLVKDRRFAVCTPSIRGFCKCSCKVSVKVCLGREIGRVLPSLAQDDRVVVVFVLLGPIVNGAGLELLLGKTRSLE